MKSDLRGTERLAVNPSTAPVAPVENCSDMLQPTFTPACPSPVSASASPPLSPARRPRRAVLPALPALAISLLALPSLASPSAPPDGAALFERSCAACHAGGGNIIGFARGKNLKTKALAKFGFDEPGKIVSLMRDGRGAMPGYGVDVFSDEEAQAVAEFVLSAAERGWK